MDWCVLISAVSANLCCWTAGWLQTRVLGCLGCVWFNRGEDKDRVQTSSRFAWQAMCFLTDS